eukprot:4483119-Lingulodinium_polyedra.AAC.1
MSASASMNVWRVHRDTASLPKVWLLAGSKTCASAKPRSTGCTAHLTAWSVSSVNSMKTLANSA